MNDVTQKVNEWVKSFQETLDSTVDQPLKEIMLPGLSFCDWRISYGIYTKELDQEGKETGKMVHFMSFYPAFCETPKETHHYMDTAQLAKDVMAISEFLSKIENLPESANKIDVSDIVACAFAILRNKESIEPFDDQKGFVDLGLQHYHLDNYYQNMIKGLCSEFYKRGTLLGKPFHISLFDKVHKEREKRKTS